MTIYIHIPFCKTRCIYCDFFSTTENEIHGLYINKVKDELKARRDYIQEETVSSIYLGGGTPSQIDIPALRSLFDCIYSLYSINTDCEVTMEANPDDLSPAYISEIRNNLPVNRLSIGIQSFNDRHLAFLRRRHTASAAINAVRECKAKGLNNISIDLMYGLPGQTLQEWDDDITSALSLNVEHISAYSLMFEEGTLIQRMLSRGDIAETDEETCRSMFENLRSRLMTAGYRHYEISNFCKPGRHSRHNSAYWDGTLYLGAGAGAHSYNGTSRQSNPTSLDKYLKMNSGDFADKEGIIGYEPISECTRYNEYVMTALRTSAGINLSKVEHGFGSKRLSYLLSNARRHINNGTLQVEPYTPVDCDYATGEKTLKLTPKGIFVSDGIMADLMDAE
jgi:oxygen-independent coproporphyrinogen-3 oxidase